jgi:SAM-dependent methyltransferase
MTTPATLDMTKVEGFMHQIIGDLSACTAAVLVRLGDRLGLYRAMADGTPLTSADLAARTDLAERYVREWLHAHAAGGWVDYDPETATFTLPAEHAVLVADPDAPTFLLGGFDWVPSFWADADTLEAAFRTGEGIGWHQHDDRLFAGTERFFGPGYKMNLVSSWLPAIDGLVPRLEAGARVADVGCGYGAATILLAQAFPRSEIHGFDYHDASIATARSRAAGAGVSNVDFEVRGATDFPGRYDLICLFDCLHDMGDPVAALRHIHEHLTDDGVLLTVEPAAQDRPEDNHAYPLGRLFYSASTMICMPGSLAQPGGLGTGNQVGPTRLTELMEQAGFRAVRVATTTPVNLILESRP